MKKCNDCGRLVNEHLGACPHCRTAFDGPPPPPQGMAMATAGGGSYAAAGVAEYAQVSAGPMSVAAPTTIASFWIRLGAYMIDYFIMVVPIFVFSFIGGFMAAASGNDANAPALINAMIVIAYLAGFVIWCVNSIYYQGTTGASLGKRACHLVVLKPDGQVLGIGGTLLREIFKNTISAICMLGFIWQAFDNEGQALHDKVAGSYVYYDN